MENWVVLMVQARCDLWQKEPFVGVEVIIFLKRPANKYFRFVGHIVPVAVTQLCHYSRKAAIESVQNGV